MKTLLTLLFAVLVIGCNRDDSSDPTAPLPETNTVSVEVSGDTVVLALSLYQGPNHMCNYLTTDTAPALTASLTNGNYVLMVAEPIPGYTIDPMVYFLSLPAADTSTKRFVVTEHIAPVEEYTSPVDPPVEEYLDPCEGQ